ncbi:hypothetical protein HanRHA438_Chr15g0728401 [Helianthus annuus]|nr:hypothetical protein HanIR_Chr15g0779221 [Helianthus annuus]KAJ0846749.1 hypothetical protein HanRHA438_Chr15g0728401 [Helianthus annuus]
MPLSLFFQFTLNNTRSSTNFFLYDVFFYSFSKTTTAATVVNVDRWVVVRSLMVEV